MFIKYTARHKKARLTVKSRTGANGVKKIVRDSYSNSQTSWFDIIKRVLARDGKKCVQCSSTNGLDVHHILPISRGGCTVMSNLITLCDKCHRSRHKHMR